MHLDGWSTATADKLTLLHDHPLLNNSNIIVIKRGTAIVVHEEQIVCERNKIIKLLKELFYSVNKANMKCILQTLK